MASFDCTYQNPSGTLAAVDVFFFCMCVYICYYLSVCADYRFFFFNLLYIKKKKRNKKGQKEKKETDILVVEGAMIELSSFFAGGTKDRSPV